MPIEERKKAEIKYQSSRYPAEIGNPPPNTANADASTSGSARPP